MRRSALAVAVLLPLASCVKVVPPQSFTPQDAHFDASPETVWQALTMVYTDLNLPIENMDRSSWFLRSDEMVDPPGDGNGEIADCGKVPGYRGSKLEDRANMLTLHTSITTLLIPRDDGTDVRNRVNTRGGLGSAAVECYSTGTLERRITEALQARLR